MADSEAFDVYSCIHCMEIKHVKAIPNHQPVETTPNPTQKAMNELGDLIMDYYLNCIPTDHERNVIQTLSEFIIDCIKELLSYEEYQIDDSVLTNNDFALIFGSVESGIQSKYSDIDIAIHLPQLTSTVIHSKQIHNEHRNYAIKLLSHLAEIIDRKHITYHDPNPYTLQIQRVLKAKVPIIRVTDPHSKAESDISLANYYTKPGVRLMKMFTCFEDDRIKPFILFLKMWSKQRGINDAFRGYLNSFGFTLLAIKYLQMVSPSILPIYRFSLDHKDITISKASQHTQNQMNLAELLYGFLYFYGEIFDPQCGSISVLSEGWCYKHCEQFMCHVSQKYFILQDPVQITHNVAKNVRFEQWNHIRNECRRCVYLLSNYHVQEDIQCVFRLLTQDAEVVSYSDYNVEHVQNAAPTPQMSDAHPNNDLNEQITDLFDALSKNDAVNDLFKTKVETESVSYIVLDGVARRIECAICMEPFKQSHKVYVAHKDEWILNGACYLDGSVTNHEGKDNKSVVHWKCFELKSKQYEMDACHEEGLHPVLLDDERDTNVNKERDEVESGELSPCSFVSSLSSLSSLSGVSSLTDGSAEDGVESCSRSRSRSRDCYKRERESRSCSRSRSRSRSRNEACM
eukprot:334347_1